MNPLKQLQRLLSNRGALQTTGEVIEILPASAYRVRTATGTLEVKAIGAVAYTVGDTVLVREGVIQGRLKDQSSIPVYHV